MKKKPQTVYVPLTMCSDCGGMRCAVLGAIREHPDFEDGNRIIVTLLGIVAELLSAAPPQRDDDSAEVVSAIFSERLAELRALGARDGEIVH